MKFRFIEAEKGEIPVISWCRVLRVSEPGYYAYLRRRDQPDRRIGDDEPEVREAVRQAHRRTRGRYGRPRIVEALRQQGHRIGPKRVGRIMRELVLRGRSGRKKTRGPGTLPSGSAPAENLLQRDFTPRSRDMVWAGDITMIEIGDRKVWLAVVIDLFSRNVVGEELGVSPSAQLVCRAMAQATQDRRPPRGLIFHSDQGSQYGSDRFQYQLRILGIRQSMSRRGNCWDNAVVESYFATLKREVDFDGLSSLTELRAALAEFRRFYNHERLHSTLGYLSPVEHEARMTH